MIGLIMSIEAYKWAKEQELPGVLKSVLICIADRLNARRGYAWPSIARIAKDTGWSTRTVAKAIRALREAGLIETRQQFYARDYSKGPNRYYIPQLGSVPSVGTKFLIQGDFDWRGDWDPELEFEYEMPDGFESDSGG